MTQTKKKKKAHSGAKNKAKKRVPRRTIATGGEEGAIG